MSTPRATEEAEIIGRRIRHLRESRQLTQKDLGLQLGYVAGFQARPKSRSAIAQWENGHATPSIHEFKMLAHILETTPHFLAFGIAVTPADRMLQIPIVDVEGPEKFSQTGLMAVDPEYVKRLRLLEDAALKAYDIPHSTKGIPIEGASVGDRLLIDTSQRLLEGNGEVVLLWDIHSGPRIAHISTIPGRSSKLSVRVGSTYFELPKKEMLVVGRVAAFIGRLN